MPFPSHARGYESFAGTIAASTPDRTYPPTAPAGAPNILVVLVDDLA